MSVMPWGLLWFDADPKHSLEEKVQGAIERYVEKHGVKPNVCYVHPSAIEGDVVIDECRLIAHSSVLKNHWWIGVRE
jgi:hypothetical protein